MKKFTLTVALFGLLLFSLAIPVGASSTGWSQTYGGTENDGALSLVQTSDGGYAMVGYTCSFGAGEDDFWLIKTDETGSMQWNRTYGGVGADIAICLVETSDGGYALVGYTESFGAGSDDVWFVKTDEAGSMQWNRTYGGAGVDIASSLVETSDGGYAIAGYTFPVGAANSDIWLIKTDEQGVIPEFPSWIILPAFLMTSLVAIIIKKRLSKRFMRTQNGKSRFKKSFKTKHHQWGKNE